MKNRPTPEEIMDRGQRRAGKYIDQLEREMNDGKLTPRDALWRLYGFTVSYTARELEKASS